MYAEAQVGDSPVVRVCRTASCNRLSVSQTISIRVGKNEDQLRGFINNKQEGWSFPVDAVRQEQSSLTITSLSSYV